MGTTEESASERREGVSVSMVSCRGLASVGREMGPGSGLLNEGVADAEDDCEDSAS